MMMTVTRLTPPLTLTRGAAGWLVFSLMLAISWHIPHTPVWVLIAVPILAYWRFTLLTQKKPLPPRFLRLGLTVAAFVGVLLTYQSYMGRDPGITALIILSSLKLFELKTQRDFMFIIFLCYFLVFGNFLYSQSMHELIFMMVAVVLITAAVLRLNHGEKQPVKIKFLLKSGFRFFLLSIPFMAALFLLFPRTTVPLWNLPQESAKKGTMGFNDSVQPGQVAELATSNATAFRVSFPDNNMPEQRDLYFRGLLLWFTNGKGWYQGILRSPSRRRFSVEGEPVIQQYITLEPHYERWLFALDAPVELPRRSRLLPGRIFQAYWPLSKIIQYGVVSALKPQNPETINNLTRRWALQMPSDRESELFDLARSWRAEVDSDAELVRKIMDHFRTGGFEYSLTPGALDPDRPLEDFFYNTKKGFCEHYAAVFTLMMRAAGIPSRMVAGYQGGEYNDVGDYLLVRQSDAHAWSEVWLEPGGWTRVDPTAAVSPDRVEFGAEMSRRLSQMKQEGEDSAEAVRRANRRGFFGKIFRFFEKYWDSINNKWDLWIMTYDRYRQRDFMETVGLGDVGRWSLLAVLIIVVPVIFIVISLLLKRRAVPANPLVKLYRRFYMKTAKRGVRPARWEGPLDFRLRAVDAFPHRAKEIQAVIDHYVRMRYGRTPVTKEALKEFKQMVKTFSVRQ